MKPHEIWTSGHSRVWIFGSLKSEEIPIVCLHEGLGCLELWRDFPEKLYRSTGRAVILIERRGHGRSGSVAPESNPGYLQHEATIALPTMLDELNLSRVYLLGHSDGGTIALHFGARFPERVERVISLAAHVYADQNSFKGVKQALKTFETSNLREKMVAYHGERTEGMFYRWARTWTDPEFQSWSIESELGSLTRPVLAIQGEDDLYGEREQLQVIARAVSGLCQTHLLPGVGHNPHLEQPDLCVSLVTRFLESPG